MMLSNGKAAKMPDKKLTDNEIKKALERCLSNENGKCEECPLEKYHNEVFTCLQLKQEYSLALINRLQAENENLIAEVEKQKKKVEARNIIIAEQKAKIDRLKKYDEERDILLHARLTANAKIDAYKEFAERLETKLFIDNDNLNPVVTKAEIDETYKEMVGEGK